MAKNIYAKYINETTIERLRLPIRDGGEDIFTNDPEVLLSYGYKLVVYTEAPEVEEGYYAEQTWTDGEREITQTWTIKPIISIGGLNGLF